MYHNYIGRSASTGSELLHLFNKLDNIVGQQLGLLKGTKMTPFWHKSVGVDVLKPSFCPRIRDMHQLPREGGHSSGHKYPNPKAKTKDINMYT